MNSTGNTPRTLVLCFDGTADQYDKDNSNVVKFFSLLSKDPNEQLCYYDAGVGTWYHPGVVSPLFNWIAKIVDLACAWYLEAHVLDGYKFLMQNYRAGDKICLFGFSRGAYTARALAGFLHKIGLLSKDNVSQVTFAYEMYQREDDESLDLCEGFKKTFCQSVRVEFMGLWDTVASVGLIMGRTLPFTNSNSSITTFRHALALDERRARFRPNFYHRPTPALMRAAVNPRRGSSLVREAEDLDGSDPSAESRSSSVSSVADKGKSKLRKVLAGKEKEAVRSVMPEVSEPNSAEPTREGALPDDVFEVWFVGGHSDVGGGNSLNKEQHSLSNIPLRWMVREVIKAKCGIAFLPDTSERLRLGEAEEADVVDALQPVNDRLAGSFKQRMWWILELIPLSYAHQDEQGVWHRSYGWHFGRGRDVYTPNPNFHRSVRVRMRSSLGYKPKVQWKEGSEEYVDYLL